MRRTLATLSLLLLAAPASAQTFRNVPQGGRTATMGGAGVATGVDNAMPYLNPAGIAGTPHDVFSISADVYSYARASVHDLFVPSSLAARYGDLAIARQEFRHTELVTTPSGIAYFKRLGRHVFSLSLTTLSYELSEKNGAFRAQGSTGHIDVDYLESIRTRAFGIGPSYALAIGARLRIGVSALLTYSDFKTDDHTTITFAKRTPPFTDPGLVTTSVRNVFDLYSIGATFVGGMQAQPIDDVWIGAAIEMFGLPIKGGGHVIANSDRTFIDATPAGLVVGPTGRKVDESTASSYAESRPMRFSLGAAYHKPDKLTIAADAHMMVGRPSFRRLTLDTESVSVTTTGNGPPGPQTIETRSRAASESSFGTRTTFNVSMGGELFISKTVSVRAGLYTDIDANEVRRANATFDNNRLSWYCASLGFGSKDGDFETTYGVVYRLGRGTIVRPDNFGEDPTATAKIPYTVHGVMFVLSGVVRTDKGAH